MYYFIFFKFFYFYFLIHLFFTFFLFKKKDIEYNIGLYRIGLYIGLEYNNKRYRVQQLV